MLRSQYHALMTLMKVAIPVAVLGLSAQPCSATPTTCADDGYSMYVWTNGFNPSASHCGGVYPINRVGDNATCFEHNWETPSARQKLWTSCTQPGREVTRIFVSDVKNRIEPNGYNEFGNCDTDLITLLTEAHELGIRVYALFSDSTAEFNESYMASYPNLFNTNCGTTSAYFDGVAVNNEYFANIKSCDAFDVNNKFITEQQEHLDLLQLTADNATPLPLHFSVSWNWDCCSCSSSSYATRDLQWPAVGGSSKSVMAHMVDIVDSVDVQVAFIKNSTMTSRTSPAYQYWNQKVDKTDTSGVYVLSYTNPTSLCQTSYSPHVDGSTTVEDTCSIGNPRTEAGMFQGFDYVEEQLPSVKGSIHFMNGVYASGITSGWPVHSASPTASPSCLALPGQCSDGTGTCSTSDMTQCVCANRRNLLERGFKSKSEEAVLLRGTEMRRPVQRKLPKPVKTTPSPTAQTPQPTDRPTKQPTSHPTVSPAAFQCTCVLPTPAPTAFPTKAATPSPTKACTPAEQGCSEDSQCCSGNCHTGGGRYANKCKPA